MQFHSARTFPPSPSPKEAIPYTSEALRHDLQRVRDAWADCQSNRSRDAIYGYLNAVYGLVAVWTSEGREIDRARRSRPSFGARPTRLRPTSGRGASGAGLYATRQPTSRIRSLWTGSSEGRAGSINAPLVSRGVWGEVGQRGPRDGWLAYSSERPPQKPCTRT